MRRWQKSLASLAKGSDFTPSVTPGWYAGLVWLAIFASVVAFSSYLTLVGRIGPGRAGYATVLFPVLALLLSTLFEDFNWQISSLAGLLLVMAGNLVMVRAKS